MNLIRIRHAFLAGCLILALSLPVLSQQQAYIELRTYQCSSVTVRDTLLTVFDSALIPALNRQGVKQAGVYASSAARNKGREEYDTMLFTVAVYPTLEAFATSENKLLSDPEYMRAAAAIFKAPVDAPLYDSCRSSLLCTFQSCPAVVQTAKNPDRILQLRIYNSYNIERNASKIAMFESGGEIQLFREAGMPPVFFGHALTGEQLPNLTYLLAFENEEAQKQAWNKFVNSEGWKKLKNDPQYKDTATEITNIILNPSENSQL